MVAVLVKQQELLFAHDGCAVIEYLREVCRRRYPLEIPSKTKNKILTQKKRCFSDVQKLFLMFSLTFFFGAAHTVIANNITTGSHFLRRWRMAFNEFFHQTA